MAHYIIVPTNENGVIFDGNMNNVVAEAMAESPFGFEDVFVYSHGWSTDAYQAMDEYNLFSVELARTIAIAQAAGDPSLVNPPRPFLGLGIHWPSEITEDPNSLLNALQLLTFYSMGSRAESVGKNSLYAMVRLILTTRASSTKPLRFFFLGHSFGCRVVCAALNDLQVDMAAGAFPRPQNVTFRAILLEAALDNDNLDPGDIYGAVAQIPGLRLLMTTSSLDAALQTWYVKANAAQNLFHRGNPTPALGAAGPTAAMSAAFGGRFDIPITTTFQAAALTAVTSRLTVADLTSAHSARQAANLYSGGISGSHSDINFGAIYQMVMGFLFS